MTGGLLQGGLPSLANSGNSGDPGNFGNLFWVTLVLVPLRFSISAKLADNGAIRSLEDELFQTFRAASLFE